MQSIVGSFLHYARALDYILLPEINETSATQENQTEHAQQEYDHMLDYVETYSDMCVRFHASDVVLHVDSDAACLVISKAKSRTSGY